MNKLNDVDDEIVERRKNWKREELWRMKMDQELPKYCKLILERGAVYIL